MNKKEKKGKVKKVNFYKLVPTVNMGGLDKIEREVASYLRFKKWVSQGEILNHYDHLESHTVINVLRNLTKKKVIAKNDQEGVLSEIQIIN